MSSGNKEMRIRRIKELEEERDRLQTRLANIEGHKDGPMCLFLETAERRGWTIQLVPPRASNPVDEMTEDAKQAGLMGILNNMKHVEAVMREGLMAANNPNQALAKIELQQLHVGKGGTRVLE